MAAPVYATDLTDMLLDMASTTGWTALGGGAAGLVAPETDFFIQGSNCISKAGWNTATKGMIYNFGSGITVPTDGAVLMWQYFWAPNSLATKASGGIQLLIGSGTAAYNAWYTGGSDNLTFGGWLLGAVNPTVTVDAVTGSPTTTLQYFGTVANVPSTGPAKGQPLGIDAFRYGRGELRCTNGDGTSGYATFDGANTYGSDVTRRWGLCSKINGSYQLSGLFVMGLAATAVDFRDSNRVCFFRDHDRTTANFNGIEVRNASSNVVWTNIYIQALGTHSPGKWTTTDNAPISLTGCSFINMGTFGFLSNLTATTCIWRGCDQITAAGSTITNSTISGYIGAANSSALVWNVATDPNGKLDGNTFTMGATATHAIEFGTSSPTTMTLTNVNFSGYNASNNQNDSTLWIRRTTGTVTINIVGGSTPSYRTDGATVSLVINPVTTTITVQDVSTSAAISGARVLVIAASGGPLPYQKSTTIVRSGSTATATCTAHGLSDGKEALIQGATQTEYNGVFTITVTGTDTFTYTVSGTPATPATGTITTTGVVINGTTNGSGVISDTRTFTADQPVTGRARMSTSAPYYKTGTITGTISHTAGFSETVQLIPDQ